MFRKHYNFVLIILLSALLGSCTVFTEDLTEARKLAVEKKYQEALAILDGFKSGNSKKYNSKLRVEYAVEILKDLNQSKSERHQLAKTLLEEAVRLDPKNTRARTFYLALLKTTTIEEELVN